MGDNDMRISYKGWFVFSQALHLLVALSEFVVGAIEWNCSRWATVRLGIDTLIANILVDCVTATCVTPIALRLIYIATVVKWPFKAIHT